MHLLMIGFSNSYLRNVDSLLPERCVTVIEEPDLYRGKQLQDYDYRSVRRVVLASYQQHAAYRAAAVRINAREPLNGVVPGLEYAVEAAADVSAMLCLPGAGRQAARTLRDKLTLRHVTRAGGVRNPDAAEVSSAADVAAFSEGRPVVIKPSNRQGSLGVLLLDEGDDIEHAWDQMLAADEGIHVADRTVESRYLVEERLHGPEYSVEALVRDGCILLMNVTEKATSAGRHPVELGHLLPAPVGPALNREFESSMRALVAAIGFGTGILHAEWIVTPDGPTLVECAGRVPGDRIFELMELAYETNFYDAALHLMLDRPVELTHVSRRAAAIRFPACPAGRVVDVAGCDGLDKLAGVIAAEVTVQVGDTVGGLRCSWDRVGHVIAVGPTPATARWRADAALGSIAICTTSPAWDQWSSSAHASAASR